MKKIGKKLSYLMKVFLVCGLLFNHISPLTTVLAEEMIQDDVVVNDGVDGNNNTNDTNESDEEDDKKDDSESGETNDSENNENNNNENDDEDNNNENDENNENNNENNNDENNNENNENENPSSTDNEEELVFTVAYSETDSGIIIKYSKAAELPEGTVLSVNENFEYLSGVTFVELYDISYEEIAITDEIKTALAGEGYLYYSNILMDNIFSGTYMAEVTIGEDSQILVAGVEKESGYTLSLYNGETKLEPTDGVYVIPKDLEKITVKAKIMPGNDNPQTSFAVGDIHYTANGISFEEVEVGEIELSDYLYGDFTHNFEAVIVKNGGEEVPLTDTLAISRGDNQDNTNWLNESAKNVELDGKYIFLWLEKEGKILVGGEPDKAEIESIIDELKGDKELISYEVNVNGDQVSITLTDTHGVTVSYSGPTEVSDVNIAALLKLQDEPIKSGEEFTISYIVKLKDYQINGASGLFSYDTDMFELVDVSSEIFTGGNKDDGFLYLGEDYIPEKDDSTEVSEEEEYVILTATFKALMAGEGTIKVDKSKFYDQGEYYTSDEEISVDVVVEASSDNSFASLVVNGQEIELQDGVYEYEVTVDNSVTVPDIVATLSNDSASISSIVFPEELAEGDNEVTITIEAANGETQVYKVKITRKAAENTNNVATPVTYYENTYTADTGSDDTQIADTTGADDKDGKDADSNKDAKEKNGNLSRIIIIILILLVIAGLIYLIFKDDKDDDEETKKANKDIDKFKDNDLDYKNNERRNNPPKKNNYNNNRNNNNNVKKGK